MTQPNYSNILRAVCKDLDAFDMRNVIRTLVLCEPVLEDTILD